jgi:hypothetical protein
MKTDRELLELAAKAVAIALEWDGLPDEWQPMYYEDKTYRYWNPLTDDGDALRLAVKLRLDFYEGVGDGPEAWAGYYKPGHGKQKFSCEPMGDDPYAATRRAIVRAAAELGSQS